MRIFLPIWCLILALTTTTVSAQVCQGDVVLTTQEEVNTFDCETIYGTLLITGPDITSLTPLRGLKMVDEHVILQGLPSLTSLDGLQDLTDVTCSFEVKDCDALTDLAGLDNLTSVGRNFTVIDSETIGTLNGLFSLEYAQTLRIYNNPVLSECCALGPLLDITEDRTYINNNAPGCDITAIQNCQEELVCVGNVTLLTQEDFDNFNCTKIVGNLIIGTFREESSDWNTSSLKQLREVTGSIEIERSAPSDLYFKNLEKIGNRLRIRSNSINLDSLPVIKSVRSIYLSAAEIAGRLSLIDNPINRVVISSSNILDSLFLGPTATIDTINYSGPFTMTDEQQAFNTAPLFRKLTNGGLLYADNIYSLNGLEHLEWLNRVTIYQSEFTDLSSVENLRTNRLFFERVILPEDYCPLYALVSSAAAANSLWWALNSASSTDVLSKCTETLQVCEGDVVISNAYELLAFNCEIVEGNLTLKDLFLDGPASDLGTLRNLKEVHGNLIIRDLNFPIISLSDFQSLEMVSGDVIIEQNDYLESIQGLSNLTKIGGNLIVRNNSRMTALGVFGLQQVNDVEITHNPQLRYCCDIDLLNRSNVIQGELTLMYNKPSCTPESIQNCLENASVCDGDVYMTNQKDADTMECEIIEGNLSISGAGRIRLDSLYRLREIKGDLDIYHRVYSFDGMHNLERIGGIIYLSDYNIPTTGGTTFDLDPLVGLRSIGGFNLIIDDLNGSLNLTEPIQNIYWGYNAYIDDISWIENVPSIDTFQIDSPGNDYFGTIADRVAEGGYMDIGRVSVTDSIWKQKKYINYLRMSVETESLDFLSTLEKINTLSIGGKVTTQDICGAYNLLKNGEIGEFSGWGFQWIPPGKTEYEYLSVQYILDNCAPEVVNSLSVYPNPSGDPVVNLSWQEKGEGNTVIQVLDNNGREVMQRTTPATAGMQEAELNTASLEPGFYLIRIISNGEVKLRRFVKQ